MEDRDGVLGSGLRGDTLDGLDNDFLSLFGRRHACIVHDIVDIGHGVGLSFVLERLDQVCFGFLGGESGQLLELLLCSMVHLVYLLGLELNSLQLLVQRLRALVELVELTLEVTLTLVELLLTLLETLVHLLLFLLLLADGFLMFHLERNKFLFGFDDLVFLDHFSLFFGFLDDAYTGHSHDCEADTCSNQ